MSIYVPNILIIKGKHSQIDTIIGERFCLANAFPPPSEIYSESWCLDNWGIRFDISDDVSVEYRVRSVKIHFESPWRHPGKWLENVAKLYPELNFTLYWANEYPKCGKIKVKNGEYIGFLYNDGPDAIRFYGRYFK